MANSYTTEDERGRTTVIETRRGGANAGLMVALIVIIALVAAIAFFLFSQSRNDDVRTEAVVGTAESIDQAAKNVSRSISDAAERVAPERK